ncbi:GNAT family N-acetyltransferase [Leuconostoc fallax]|uniref:GNAT family N-acetyltransferase n=1 Tax=Leuconostoc fallax TaxID=1251 RepID=UPI002091114C|nr:GNAT family N-acetyltransferase [Leuconostoc fallax]MCO6183662.1 GNAT family N-acetyltransferase [Leuconostoc fallax]
MMIKLLRNVKGSDLDKILNLWLEGNIDGHDFIPQTYWQSKIAVVAKLLPQSNIYAYYDNSENIVGFLGEVDGYIAGLFVDKKFQRLGIGRQLVDYIKQVNNELTLSVYENNARALHFYEKNGFVVNTKQIDTETGELEFSMYWSQSTL